MLLLLFLLMFFFVSIAALCLVQTNNLIAQQTTSERFGRAMAQRIETHEKRGGDESSTTQLLDIEELGRKNPHVFGDRGQGSASNGRSFSFNNEGG